MGAFFQLAAGISFFSLPFTLGWSADSRFQDNPSELGGTGSSSMTNPGRATVSDLVMPGEWLHLQGLSSGSVRNHVVRAVQDVAVLGQVDAKSELKRLMMPSWPLREVATARFTATVGEGEQALQPTLAQRLDGRMPVAPALSKSSPLKPDGVSLLPPVLPIFSNAVSPDMLSKTRDIYRERGWGNGDMRMCLWGFRDTRCSWLAGIPTIFDPLVDLLVPVTVVQDLSTLVHPSMRAPGSL